MTNERKVPRWLPLFFVVIGVYVVLLSLGVIPDLPHSKKQGLFATPHHWQITSFGVAFLCAGVSAAFPDRRHWLLFLNHTVLLVAFLAPTTWVLFFSGAVSRPMQIFGGIPLVIGGLLGLWRFARFNSRVDQITRKPCVPSRASCATRPNSQSR
ncbi:hypothetical protein [Azoarcus sp. CIB]|uniref:hypothetical protein n=1 Tax=Aromatoleum sp. (strain CIB) TaxID=198107 RepID=UPI00067A7B3F|nr:hypothetical protein [Azoarcus sp. CIB]